MFGSSSPLQNSFQVQLSPAKVQKRKLSQRIRVDSDQLRKPRSESYIERLGSEVSRDSSGSDDESGERKKKTSLGSFIPRVSVFKGKSGKKQKEKIKFTDETKNDDDDEDSDGDYSMEGLYMKFNWKIWEYAR